MTRLLLAVGIAISLCGCGREPVVTHAAAVINSSPPVRRQIRATGTVQAVHVSNVQVPAVTGQGGKMTLTGLVPNGSRVKQGDILAEFDRTVQLDNARDARAKFDDLGHQVDQKKAEFLSNAEKRRSDLQKAEADLAKAKLQLRRGPLLSDIDRLKNEAKAEAAQIHVDSLIRSNRFHDEAEAANIRVLELQRDRQKVSLERAQRNSERLVIHAHLAGMVALENIWRSGAMGHAQEGDQLYSGQPYETGMMEALLIGETSKLEKVWTDDFRHTGTFHALVISGTQVAALVTPPSDFMIRSGACTPSASRAWRSTPT